MLIWEQAKSFPWTYPHTQGARWHLASNQLPLGYLKGSLE